MKLGDKQKRKSVFTLLCDCATVRKQQNKKRMRDRDTAERIFSQSFSLTVHTVLELSEQPAETVVCDLISEKDWAVLSWNTLLEFGDADVVRDVHLSLIAYCNCAATVGNTIHWQLKKCTLLCWLFKCHSKKRSYFVTTFAETVSRASPW